VPAVRPEESLITLAEPASAAAEQFRRLRTNVQFADIDRPLRTLAVAAPRAASGASTIVANLAVAFAQSGKEVILVDADLLNPIQHAIFGVGNSVGLVNVLAGDVSPEMALQRTPAAGVQLLTAGTPPANPAQVLNSPRMDAVIGNLLDFANVVLFDTPALAALADSALFAARADGVLLVADSGTSRRGDMRSARDLLDRVHARVLGVALNHAQAPRGLLGSLLSPA
jgi:capsular exopolysaccharide synthesis family protein